MLPKYPIKAQNATNTESTDVAVFIVPDGAISGNEVDISAGGIAIGDTITDATEGSVLFAGAAGVLAQNNTAFKWVNADTQLQLTAGGATKTPLYVKLAGSQTADAFQVANSSGVVQFRIDSTGNVFGFNSTNGVYSVSGETRMMSDGSGLRWDGATLFTNSPLDLGASGLGWRRQYFNESTAPAAPAANCVAIFAQDNGGKTELMALFATGVAQQIAIEP